MPSLGFLRSRSWSRCHIPNRLQVKVGSAGVRCKCICTCCGGWLGWFVSLSLSILYTESCHLYIKKEPKRLFFLESPKNKGFWTKKCEGITPLKWHICSYLQLFAHILFLLFLEFINHIIMNMRSAERTMFRFFMFC